ncbi:hypothetical protein KCQ_12915 [Pectobacterium atrosepticum ICMP 1526]|nr:hypothetical protein KCQ_12915 [Pectobacterium atrosepticum ICMP 1526]
MNDFDKCRSLWETHSDGKLKTLLSVEHIQLPTLLQQKGMPALAYFEGAAKVLSSVSTV